MSAQEQRTNRATNRGRRLQKSNENGIKSTPTTPKICTDQIQCATNLAPKNHFLGLIQTPGKRDRRHERKWEKLKNTVTKITHKITESRRTTGGFGPPFPHRISVYTHEFLHKWTSLLRTRRRANPRWKGENERMGKEVREMGAPSSYLTGLLHNPSFAPGYY